MRAVGHNFIVLLAILECVWVSLACMKFLILTFFPLNIMIRSSPAFSKKKPLSVEPQDVTNFSGGGTPTHLQDHSDSRFKVKPPCFKVYSRRKEFQAAAAQMTDVERTEKLQEFM
jgi:hypothetical protein